MTGSTASPIGTVLNVGAALIALLLVAPEAGAQKATERFIPLGQSPGLSSIYTDVSTVAAVDAAARTVTLGPTAQGRSVQVTGRTRIWIDRSKQGQATKIGDFGDLRVGRRIEVEYEDHDRRGTAAWVKVVP